VTSAGPTPENEGIDPELQAAVESAFEEVPDDVREGLAQGSPEGAAGQSDAASAAVAASGIEVRVAGGAGYAKSSPASRRFREAAFIPVQSPSESQLRWELAKARGEEVGRS